ncbi:MAG: peptidoglycan DD-metalloendopeptidase family protein [Parcubacteria group bacterium]|nr:peptidoglycan DD-metalloendopeptidase family protein [Parcubacteria group bacterium]
MGNFLNSIFRGSSKENLSVVKSVQNMALLSATIIPPVGNQTLDQLTIEKDALVSEVSPLGEAKNSVAKPTSDQISIYVVREGDTLSQIAEMFDVNINTIKWSNDLSSNTLKTGQTLIILPISGVKHTIVKGDTLSSLAKKYKGDIDEIIAYNNLKEGEALVAGEVIIIPDGEAVIKTSSGTYTNSSGSGLKEYSGYYMRPIAGGKRTQGIHGYNAVDLAAPIGTPIFAAADGEVIISKSGGWNGGYGNYIVIRHPNGTQTLYSHNSENNVSVGDTVKQGDVIGAIGSTGKSTGPHLHFEIRGAKNPF